MKGKNVDLRITGNGSHDVKLERAKRWLAEREAERKMAGANAYTDRGYRDRDHYLHDLAEAYDVPLDAVIAMSEVLGQDEDFDGLVSMVDEQSPVEM